MNTLFRKAEVTSAYLKMGLLGFAGSGKTFTATETAIGLVKYMQELQVANADKPIFFLDTETGSDWIKPKIEDAGLELFTAKTRAFADLRQAVTEAQSGASLLLVDSISHFWKELCEAYMKRRNRTRLQFEDWGFLKGEWGKFTDQFINSPLHIILCGRAGYEYDYFQDEETGKKNLEKTGIKMKAEGEMGYEPSLLVLMERQMNVAENKTWREATVLKDRSTLLDGQVFTNPTFASFLPHIGALNLGGKQLGVDTTRTSESTIPSDKRDWQPVQRRIVIDEIQTLLVLHIPGQAAADKQRKAQLIRKHFDAAWAEIEEVMPLGKLRNGYDALFEELEGKPSKYAKPEIDDQIPEHSAPVQQLPTMAAG
jgi:hypothetical protein